jgi:hypothetical protein
MTTEKITTAEMVESVNGNIGALERLIIDPELLPDTRECFQPDLLTMQAIRARLLEADKMEERIKRLREAAREYKKWIVFPQPEYRLIDGEHYVQLLRGRYERLMAAFDAIEAALAEKE